VSRFAVFPVPNVEHQILAKVGFWNWQTGHSEEIGTLTRGFFRMEALLLKLFNGVSNLIAPLEANRDNFSPALKAL
jgi:hypothetical protein